MIHIPVDVHLRKNKVPEAFPQSLRVIISRARTRQIQVALSELKNNNIGDISLLLKGTQLPRPKLLLQLSIHTALHFNITASIFTVLLF